MAGLSASLCAKKSHTGAQKFANLRAVTKPLDIEVRELLEARRGRWKEIAVAAGISHSWISQFVRGKIPNPGFVTLTGLLEVLQKLPSRRTDDEHREAA